MKKRILSMMLVLVMILTCAVPTFASEAKYDDPGLEAAYQAHLALKAALNSETKDVDVLREALEAQEAANEAADMEWEDLERMPEDYFAVMTDASAVIRFGEVRGAFLAEKNGKTAKDLMEIEASIKELDSADVVKGYFADYDAVCAEAEKLAPSENTLAVYEAFYSLNDQLQMAFWPEDLAASLDGFKQVESQFAALTEKELGDIALLMDLDATPQQTKEHICDVVKRSEDAVKVMEPYNLFSELYNSGEADAAELEKAGKAYVKLFDEVMKEADDAQTMILYNLYPELDYLYAQAKIYTLSEDTLKLYEGLSEFRESVFSTGIEAFEAAVMKYETEVLPQIEQVSAEELEAIAAGLEFENSNLMKEEMQAQLERMKTEVETGKALKEIIPSMKFRAKSVKTTLRGKKAVKVNWEVPEGVEFDGYQVMRSTQRYSGYGTEPYFETWNTSYINNKDIKKGNTYYYKVRGYKYICNEIVYSDWSWKAWRTF